MAGIDRDHVVAALRQVFEGEIARPHIDRRGADHRDRFHRVEDAADVGVVVIVVVHLFSSDPHGEERGTRVSNHEATAGPASFETREDALLRMRSNYLSCHFGSRFSMKAPMPSSASRAIMFSVITSAA